MMKKIMVFLLAVVLLFAFLPTAEIGGIAAQRERLEELRQQRDLQRTQINETLNLLTGFQSDIEDLLEVMRFYSQKMMDALADKEEIEIVMLETELRIAETEAELELVRAERDAQDEIFRERLRGMHELGTAGYLEVLFQATSFTDFLLRLEQIRAISQFDQRILADREAAEERVENTLSDLARLNATLNDMYIQHQLAIAALTEAEEANAAFLAQLQETEEGYAALLALEKATEQAILEELGVVELAIRAHEAEEARIRREEELRRRQEAARIDAENMQTRLNEMNSAFDGTFHWPVPTHHEISSPFGPRTHPIRRTSENHCGIDIRAPSGTRIVAAADGIVTLATWHGGFGNTVIINHGNGYTTLYGHASRLLVSVGDSVTQGQHIANVGSTGVSTGPHLHFTIRRNGTPIDPAPFFGR